MAARMRADTRIKARRSFRICKHRVPKYGPLRPANSGNRGSYFGGEPALAAGLIQSSHDVEGRAGTEHQLLRPNFEGISADPLSCRSSCWAPWLRLTRG